MEDASWKRFSSHSSYRFCFSALVRSGVPLFANKRYASSAFSSVAKILGGTGRVDGIVPVENVLCWHPRKMQRRHIQFTGIEEPPIQLWGWQMPPNRSKKNLSFSPTLQLKALRLLHASTFTPNLLSSQLLPPSIFSPPTGSRKTQNIRSLLFTIQWLNIAEMVRSIGLITRKQIEKTKNLKSLRGTKMFSTLCTRQLQKP